jgi:hypothetical protein
MAQETQEIGTIHAIDKDGNRYEIVESIVLAMQRVDRGRALRGTQSGRRFNLRDGTPGSHVRGPTFRFGDLVLTAVMVR